LTEASLLVRPERPASGLGVRSGVPSPASRSFRAIVNPNAGGEVMAAIEPVAAALSAAGAPVDISLSRSLDDAREIARDGAARGEIVLAVGGDGMVGAIAGAVSEAAGVVGIVAAGRGNDFARQLGVPRDAAGLAELFLDGEPRVVDIVEAAGTLVVGSVYAGLDSIANAIANRSRFVPKRFVYDLGAARALLRWKPVSYRLDIDGPDGGSVHEFRGYTVVVANSGYYGSGLYVAPSAAVDDGLLDVVCIADAPRRAFLRTIKLLRTGRHLDLDIIEVHRARRVTITADRAVPAYGDGEAIVELPITVELRPGALRVLAPVVPPDGA